jgi:hypothetical protein
VYQALKNGDNVIGLTCNPSKLVMLQGSAEPMPKALTDLKLTMIAGDVTEAGGCGQGLSAKIDGVVSPRRQDQGCW